MAIEELDPSNGACPDCGSILRCPTGIIYWCPQCRTTVPMASVAEAGGGVQGEPPLGGILREHYLAQVVCDHERKMDNPICACSLVHLGWHPSVGDAVGAWVGHVLELVAAGER